MNIEVVEFYPLTIDETRGVLTGTMKIKLPELGLHILGIFVSNKKDSWFFGMPSNKGIHHATGEPVRYPFIVFEAEQQRELMDAIRTHGRAYIEKRLADKENPLVVPKTQALFSESQKIFAQPRLRIDEYKRDTGS